MKIGEQKANYGKKYGDASFRKKESETLIGE